MKTINNCQGKGSKIDEFDTEWYIWLVKNKRRDKDYDARDYI